MMEEEKEMRRTYKDTVFRMLFSEKENLLSLYNAVNGTDYKHPEDLEINTLENAIYMNMKNDISFVCGFYLDLYEHQSTYNRNMPLRNLFYIARLLEKHIRKDSIYSSKLLRIPSPRFLVFYNGTEHQPERQVLRLSDSYWRREEEPCLELKVLMLNINAGKNQKLKDACPVLKEYMVYIGKVREYLKEQELPKAVEMAVDECIKEGVLSEFLSRNRAEAIQMSIFEYDEERELAIIRRDERDIGVAQGIEQGIEQGLLLGEAKRIEQIRWKYRKGLSVTETADMLEMEEGYVQKVMEFLEKYPDEENITLAEKLSTEWVKQ